jgi:PRC-barrel domain protein
MNKRLITSIAALSLAVAGASAFAQTAGQSTLGVTVDQLQEVVEGYSAKRQIIGSTVYNEKNEKIGKIDDLIIAPDTSVSYAIIGAGGFVGVGKHQVAIPVDQFDLQDGKITLAGATKEAVKAMPEFEYAKAAKSKMK